MKVMNCVRSAVFSVILNENPSERIVPKRCLRQGCPLSSYLFLLCVEHLSCLMNDAANRGLIEGLKISRYSSPISHLLFADDCLIFTKATIQQVRILKILLKRYEEASGQCINIQKSKITCSLNSNVDTKGEIRDIVNIDMIGQYDQYLGFPSSLARTKKKYSDTWLTE